MAQRDRVVRRGVRRLGRVGRLVAARTGLALVALSAPLAAQDAFREWARDFERRLEAAESVEVARAELDGILAELDAERPLDGGDGRAGLFVVAACLRAASADGDERRALFAAATDVARESDYPELEKWVAFRRAVVHLEEGRLDEAERGLRASIDGARSETLVHAEELHLLAEVLRRRQRYQEAFEVLDVFERYTEHLGSSVFFALDDRARARYHAMLHGSRAQVLRWMGLPDLAALELAEEREHAYTSGAPEVLASHLSHEADLLLFQERDAEVVERLTAAAEEPWFERLVQRDRAALELARGLAQLELERDAAARGVEVEETARGLLEGVAGTELADPVDRLLANVNLGELAVREGDLQRAERALARARELADRRLGPSDLYEEALLVTEESRLALARGDDDDARTRRVRAAMREAYDALLDAWARTRLRPGGVGFLAPSGRREIVSTLVRATLALDGEEASLNELLRAEAMGSVARSLALGPATLASLRGEWLGEEHGALVYLVGRNASHVFAFDRDRLVHASLPAAAELEVALAPWSRVLERGHGGSDGARVAGLAARRALLPEAIERFLSTCGGVTVVGLAPLGSPTLTALPDPELPDRSLGTSLALDRLPSLAIGLHLARRKRAADPSEPELDLLLAIDSTPSEAARELASTAVPFEVPPRRVDALCEPFARTRVLLDREVTVDALFPERRTAVLHVVAHGVYDERRERGALLALAGDSHAPGGLVGSEEIEAAGTRRGTAPRLVLLSACSAARGPRRLGDDALTHLGGAFLSAGADAVVLSSRAVELGASIELMTRVHGALADGASPAEALRRARLGGSDALHLTRFEVIGLGQQPVFR